VRRIVVRVGELDGTAECAVQSCGVERQGIGQIVRDQSGRYDAGVERLDRKPSRNPLADRARLTHRAEDLLEGISPASRLALHGSLSIARQGGWGRSPYLAAKTANRSPARWVIDGKYNRTEGRRKGAV